MTHKDIVERGRRVLRMDQADHFRALQLRESELECRPRPFRRVPTAPEGAAQHPEQVDIWAVLMANVKKDAGLNPVSKSNQYGGKAEWNAGQNDQ